MLLVFAAILLSESSQQSMFSYSQLSQGFPVLHTGNCHVCYGSNDCFPLEHLMCNYYMETQHHLEEYDDIGDENEFMKQQVDEVLFEVVENAKQSSPEQCLPLISFYTDCTKENICTNCKRCSCDRFGKWNCTNPQCSSSNPETEVIHHVLLNTMNTLLFYIEEHTNTNNNFGTDNETASVNRIKRDTIDVVNDTIPYINSDNTTNTHTSDEIQKNIINPLNSIINNKQNEINRLRKIRENLKHSIKNLKIYNRDSISINTSNTQNNTKMKMSIYELEMEPLSSIEYELTNTNISNNLIYKLKRDIDEILNDLNGIKKYSETIKISDNLKTLIQAMESYVKNDKNNKTINITKELRNSNIKDVNIFVKSVIHRIVYIINIIDKEMHTSSALAPLSDKARKIMRRVINANYVFDTDGPSSHTMLLDYNITNILENIGNIWQKLSDNLAKCSVYDRIYAVKLLYYQFLVDIVKINDTLNVLKAANNRRMINIEDNMGDVLVKISQGLHIINEKIELIIKMHEEKKLIESLIHHEKKKINKESFFKRSKTALRNFRKDITRLFKKNTSKNASIKQMAKKGYEINENLVDYEHIMRKWRNNLNIVHRDKRSNN